MSKHWTEHSLKDFLYRIASDFVMQLEERMKSLPLSRSQLADKLEVGKSAVSQLLNNPGNLKLDTIIQYARAVKMKVAIVAYDDNDPDNERGPINSDIFRICWERQNKPADFWALEETQPDAKPEEHATVPAGPGAAYILPPGFSVRRGRSNPSWLSLGETLSDRLAKLEEAKDDIIPAQVSTQNVFADLGERQHAAIGR